MNRCASWFGGPPPGAWLTLGALCVALAGCSDDDPGEEREIAPGCDPDATGWTVWVTNQGEGVDTVTVFRNHGSEEINAEILATISVGRAPHNVAFSPDGRVAYVANLGTPPEPGSVSIIDTASYEVIETVTVGIKAHGVTATPDGRELWVANVGSDEITIIDTETWEPEPETIAVGDGPALVAFLPDGSKAYVSNGTDGTTSVIDVATRTVIKTITTGAGAMGLVVSHDGRLVFETEGEANHVSAIDTASDMVVNEITFGETLVEPHDLALVGNELLLTNRTEDSLAFVDVHTLEQKASVAIPGRPDIIGFSPDCDRAYVTLRDTQAVAVVDIPDRKFLDLVDLDDGDLHGIAVLPDPD